MSTKKYTVTLTKKEKDVLRDIFKRGKHNAGKHKRAQALLLAEENYTDDMIAKRTRLSRGGWNNCVNGLLKQDSKQPLKGSPAGINKSH